jgi:hypothetical protein
VYLTHRYEIKIKLFAHYNEKRVSLVPVFETTYTNYIPQKVHHDTEHEVRCWPHEQLDETGFQGSKVSHGSFDKRDQLLSNDDRNTLADGEIPWLPERRERK